MLVQCVLQKIDNLETHKQITAKSVDTLSSIHSIELK